MARGYIGAVARARSQVPAGVACAACSRRLPGARGPRPSSFRWNPSRHGSRARSLRPPTVCLKCGVVQALHAGVSYRGVAQVTCTRAWWAWVRSMLLGIVSDSISRCGVRARATYAAHHTRVIHTLHPCSNVTLPPSVALLSQPTTHAIHYTATPSASSHVTLRYIPSHAVTYRYTP